uniref:DUF834 domain-containing protein n=1 Tax=Oryza barthii TaxID=65489 RepID=A0A0D3HKD2_9ORYZ
MEVGSLLCSALLAGRPLAAGGEEEEEEEKREWNREELTELAKVEWSARGTCRYLRNGCEQRRNTTGVGRQMDGGEQRRCSTVAWGGGTEELAVLVSSRGGTRARTRLHRYAAPRVPEPAGAAPHGDVSLALAKERGPSVLHAQHATPCN